MIKEKISLVWFKKDLRVNDNLALLSASKVGLPVLPLYIFEKDYWKQDFSSQRHWESVAYTHLRAHETPQHLR